MPGSATMPGRPSACDGVHVHIAFRLANIVGTRMLACGRPKSVCCQATLLQLMAA